MITRELRKVLQANLATQFPIPGIVKELGAMYHLENNELRVISILYLWEDWKILNKISSVGKGIDFNKTISELCGLSITDYALLTTINSNLRKKGLICDKNRFIHSNEVGLSPSLLLAIGSRDLNQINSSLYRESRKAKYSVDQFSVPPLEKEFILNALRGNKIVLIVGDSGVGKTEFAYGAAEYLGKNLLNLRINSPFYSDYTGQSVPQNRLLMTRIASSLICSAKEMLLIDEADAMLQSAGDVLNSIEGGGGYDKGELNSLLDDMNIPAIWITNSIERVPVSALRRFAYVYKFPHPNMSVRSKMLEEKLLVNNDNEHPDLIESISRRYYLTPSAMERMVDVVKSMDNSNMRSDTFSVIVEGYLDTASKGPLKYDFRKLPSASGSFDPELSSASVPLDMIVNQIRKRSEKKKPTRILFEGPPGGGKTQFSLYLASVIGKEAIIKKPSDLLSPFVGVAENNINTMFREAENSEAVLILDEADALLSDRTFAQKSWELSRASEFLQGIQDFKGILIACTNRVESLDPAIRRRFHQRVTFGALKSTIIEKALNHMFPGVGFSQEQIELLKNGPPIMMSDIANAAEMFDMEDSSESEMIIYDIMDNAKNRDMSNIIGF